MAPVPPATAVAIVPLVRAATLALLSLVGLAPATAATTSTSAVDLDPRHGTAPNYGRFQDDAIVTSGEFPGSITIPSTGISLRVGGFVNVDIIHDIDSLGFGDFIIPATIPVDGSPVDGTSQTLFSARGSRINFDVRGHSDLGELRAFVEADFLGDGDELTSTYQFQLRHAAAQVGHLYFGQWWSSFVDVASIPEGANAPLGALTLRQPGVRWGQNLGAMFRVVVGVESPAGSITSEVPPAASDSFPDVVGSAQFRTDHLRLKLAGLLRRLETDEDEAWAGGGSLSGRIQLPFLGVHDNLAFQGQFGLGISRYYQAFASFGLDALVGPDGTLNPIEVLAGYVALQHWWSDRWRSSISASAIDFGHADTTAATTFESAQLYMVNLYWSPVDRTTFGVDAAYALRRNFGEEEGSGLRISATARLDFWDK